MSFKRKIIHISTYWLEFIHSIHHPHHHHHQRQQQHQRRYHHHHRRRRRRRHHQTVWWLKLQNLFTSLISDHFFKRQQTPANSRPVIHPTLSYSILLHPTPSYFILLHPTEHAYNAHDKTSNPQFTKNKEQQRAWTAFNNLQIKMEWRPSFHFSTWNCPPVAFDGNTSVTCGFFLIPSIHPSFRYPSGHPITHHSSFHFSFTHSSVHPSIHRPFIHPLIHLFICLTIHLPICPELSSHPFTSILHPFIHWSIHSSSGGQQKDGFHKQRLLNQFLKRLAIRITCIRELSTWSEVN